MVGKVLLNYQIEKIIEENSIFSWYVGNHTQFRKQVVIKILNPKIAANPKLKEDYIREVKQIALLQYPNIVTLYDYFEIDDTIYTIYEFLEGKSLMYHILKESGPIPEKRAIKIFTQILEAYQVSHRFGLTGGGINPNHIILQDNDFIKLNDLALSRFYQEQQVQLGDIEYFSYQSPEVINGGKSDSRSDIFVLGLVLFQLLTGKHPFEDINPEDLKFKIGKEPLPLLNKFYPFISPLFENIVSKATDSLPNQRFESITHFLNALNKFDSAESIITSKVDEKSKSFSKTKVIKPKKEKIEEVYSGDIRYINAPLIALGILGVFSILLALNYQNPSLRPPEVAMDVRDTSKVLKKQDSVTRAKKDKRIQDSIRIAQKRTKKQGFTFYTHKVKPGETLDKITKRYYTSLDTIRKYNDELASISKTKRLEPKYGVKILVREVHKLRKDETLDAVSLQFNTNKIVLYQANGIKDEFVDLFEGKEIVVPYIIVNQPTKKDKK